MPVACQIIFASLLGEAAGNKVINVFYCDPPPFIWRFATVIMEQFKTHSLPFGRLAPFFINPNDTVAVVIFINYDFAFLEYAENRLGCNAVVLRSDVFTNDVE